MCESLPQLEYICSGERPLTVHELCALIGEYLGKKTRFVSFPMGFGVFLAKALKAVSFREEGLCRESPAPRRRPRFSHEAASRDFGYAPGSFNDGLKREVEEYMKHGK